MENKQIQKETRNLNKYIGTDFRCNFKSSLSFGRKMDFQIKQVFFFFQFKISITMYHSIHNDAQPSLSSLTSCPILC